MDSILDSVKKLVGIVVEDTSFDTDLIIHINSVFTVLHQLGVGPSSGFSITNKDAKWTPDYLSVGSNIEVVKSYMVLRVKNLFDPPSSSFVMDAFKEQVAEFEWRINTQIEFGQIMPP